METLRCDVRTQQVVVSALGQLIGQVKKGARHRNDDKHTFFANHENRLPALPRGHWYAKMDVTGVPNLVNQKNRGTPRIIVRTPPDNDASNGPAYYTPDHYVTFKVIPPDYFQAAAVWISYYSR